MTLLFLLAMNAASLTAPLSGNVCGTSIVTYRIAAAPGVIIRYAGAEYTVGPSGSIEIMSVANESLLTVGSSAYNLPQDGPTDAFGAVTVSVMPPSQGMATPMLRRKASTRMAR